MMGLLSVEFPTSVMVSLWTGRVSHGRGDVVLGQV